MEAPELFYRTGKSILHSREPFNKIPPAYIPPHLHALEFPGNGRPGEEILPRVKFPCHNSIPFEKLQRM